MAGNPSGRHSDSVRLKVDSELGGRLGSVQSGHVRAREQAALAFGWIRHWMSLAVKVFWHLP